MKLQRPTAREWFLGFCLLLLLATVLLTGCSGYRVEIGQVDETPIVEVGTGTLDVGNPSFFKIASWSVKLRIPTVTITACEEKDESEPTTP